MNILETHKQKTIEYVFTVMLAVSAFPGTTVFAGTMTISDKTYTTVSSISELETALKAGETYIYLEAGTYEIPSDFITIPAGTTLPGASADTVIFETAANNTSGQAGLYITGSGLATDGTGWYCCNVEAWSSSLLNAYNGYVYANSSDSSVLNHIKIGLAL